MAPVLDDDHVVPCGDINITDFIEKLANFETLTGTQAQNAIEIAVSILTNFTVNNEMARKMAKLTIFTHFVNVTSNMFNDASYADKNKFYIWCSININIMTLVTYTIDDINTLLYGNTELSVQLKTDLPDVHSNLQQASSYVPILQ